MTQQAAYGWLYPDPVMSYGQLIGNTVTFGATLIDAAAEKFAFVFRAPKAGTITRIHFRTGTVTTGDTLRISLQDVDPATGDPDGTADQFRTQAVANGDGDKWFRTGLVTSDGTDGGVSRVVTLGQRLAIVIDFNSYVAGNLNIASRTIPSVAHNMFSYVDAFTASWAKVTNRAACNGVEYSDGSFAFLYNCLPFETTFAVTLDSTASPDEIALRFRLPVPVTLSGWWAAMDNDSDVDIVLYDSNGTSVLATDSQDKDVRVFNGMNVGTGLWSAPVALLANTFYRLSMKPTSATPMTTTAFTVNLVGLLDQIGGGQDFHWSERTDAGSWTDTATKRPMIGLLVSGFDDGAGSGGGISRARLVNAGGA